MGASRGRGLKLTPEVHAAIIRGVSAGVPIKYAAQGANVSDRTIRVWMSKGKTQTKGPYASFYAAMKKAESDAITRNMAIIQKAAAKSWQAAAWYLERRYPEEFGTNRRDIIELRAKVKELEERSVVPQERYADLTSNESVKKLVSDQPAES